MPAKRLKNSLKDPLIKNSYFLIANSLLFAGVGFIFWIIAARLFSVNDVGVGAAIISAMNFICLFALFGLDVSLIHFLPLEKDKKSVINSSFLFSSIMTTILALVFIGMVEFWSPNLVFIKQNFIFAISFIFFAIFCSLSNLQISVFAGLRETKYSFYQSLTNISRIIFLPFLAVLNAFGVFISFSITFFGAFVIGNILISRISPSYKLFNKMDIKIIKKMFKYSFKNYISNTFSRMTDFILPLMVIGILGAEMNAYFYVAWALSSILLSVPISTSKSLLAEGSYSPNSLKKNAYKTLKHIFKLIIPLIFGILIFGKYILLIFGEDYSINAYGILIVTSIASIPYTIITVYSTIKRVNHELNEVILIYASLAIIALGSGYYFMQNMGLIGIGVAWLLSNIIVSVLIIIKMKPFSSH